MSPVEFIARCTSPGFAESREVSVFLADPAFRRRVYGVLHPRPAATSGPLLRHMLGLELAFRLSGEEDNGEYFENLYGCALLLHMLGEVSDSLLLWRVKRSNFDIGVGLDVQFLVGAGIESTMSHLRALPEADAKEAADYLASCKESGDFDNLPEWLEHRTQYFRSSR